MYFQMSQFSYNYANHNFLSSHDLFEASLTWNIQHWKNKPTLFIKYIYVHTKKRRISKKKKQNKKTTRVKLVSIRFKKKPSHLYVCMQIHRNHIQVLQLHNLSLWYCNCSCHACNKTWIDLSLHVFYIYTQ